MRDWQLQHAKAQFSRLVKLAKEEGPQQVSVHGVPTIIILTKAQFDTLTQRPKKEKNLVEFLRSSPLMSHELKITRNPSMSRDIEI